MAKVATDLEQSKKLAKILSIDESADMCWFDDGLTPVLYPFPSCKANPDLYFEPAWSLSSLLNVLNFNPTVYTPMLFFYEDKWVLRFVEYGHGNVEEVTALEQVDACVDMIIRLKGKFLL